VTRNTTDADFDTRTRHFAFPVHGDEPVRMLY
jgi:hypothetical protein